MAGTAITIANNTISVRPGGFSIAPGYAYLDTVTDVADVAGVDVITVTITAPVAGAVMVIASADLYCVTCANNNEAASYSMWLTNVANGAESDRILGRLPGPSTGSALQAPIPRITIHRSFAAAAGANTFRFRAALSTTGETIRLLRPTINAAFFPG